MYLQLLVYAAGGFEGESACREWSLRPKKSSVSSVQKVQRVPLGPASSESGHWHSTRSLPKLPGPREPQLPWADGGRHARGRPADARGAAHRAGGRRAVRPGAVREPAKGRIPVLSSGELDNCQRFWNDLMQYNARTWAFAFCSTSSSPSVKRPVRDRLHRFPVDPVDHTSSPHTI